VSVPCHVEDPVTSKRLVLFSCAALTTAVVMTMVWPAEAAAQRRVFRRAPVRTAVFVSAGFYRPYYYRPFYSPFYSPFYDPFWSPYYAQYPRYYYGRSWASARIEVKPREAQVFVDGYFVGMVDQFDGVFQKLTIDAGAHRIEVRSEGHETSDFEVLIAPGETVTYKGDLKAR
jgi:hypothetical protein